VHGGLVQAYLPILSSWLNVPLGSDYMIFPIRPQLIF
jgi:hypothetical protein